VLNIYYIVKLPIDKLDESLAIGLHMYGKLGEMVKPIPKLQKKFLH